MQLAAHYSDRLVNDIQVCDCEKCGDIDLCEAEGILYEINEYWNEVASDTY